MRRLPWVSGTLFVPKRGTLSFRVGQCGIVLYWTSREDNWAMTGPTWEWRVGR